MGAERQFDQYGLTLQKRAIWLWAAIAVPTGTTPVLQKWQYGTLGASGKLTNAVSSGGGATQFTKYNQGADGVFSVARGTGAGLWTVTLQDTYIRTLNVYGSMATKSGSIAPNIVAIVEDLTISNYTAANQTVIGLQLLSATGTRADPTADASTIIRVTFEICDASMP